MATLGQSLTVFCMQFHCGKTYARKATDMEEIIIFFTLLFDCLSKWVALITLLLLGENKTAKGLYYSV